MRPGWVTTEFWATVGTNVVGLVLSLASVFGHVIDPTQLNALVPVVATLASALATTVYAHTRAKVKVAVAQGIIAGKGVARV